MKYSPTPSVPQRPLSRVICRLDGGCEGVNGAGSSRRRRPFSLSKALFWATPHTGSLWPGTWWGGQWSLVNILPYGLTQKSALCRVQGPPARLVIITAWTHNGR